MKILNRIGSDLCYRLGFLLCLIVSFVIHAVCVVAIPVAHHLFGYPLTPHQRFALRAGIIATPSFNPVMAGVATKFIQDAKGFVGLRLFPAFYTGMQAANYYVFGRENMLNIPRNLRRAPGAAASRTRATLSGDMFGCVEQVHEGTVDDTERAKYSTAFDADAAEVARVANIVMLNLEFRVHDLATDTTQIANSTPGTKWGAAGADVIGDVDAAREIIHANTGLEANVMTISRSVFNVIKEDPTILDKIKYTQRGVLTPELLAAVFQVDELIVAGALVNTANEGQTLSPATVWGGDVVIAHRESAQDLKAPNFGRTFMWTGRTGAGGTSVYSYRQDTVSSDVHKCWQDTDEKLVGPEAGYILTNVL